MSAYASAMLKALLHLQGSATAVCCTLGGQARGGMGNSRPSSGLDNMSTLEEAMNGGTSKRE